MGCGLLSYRWLEAESAGLGRVLGKDPRGLGSGFSSANGLTSYPTFPTCQMGIIFSASLSINGRIDVGTLRKKDAVEYAIFCRCKKSIITSVFLLLFTSVFSCICSGSALSHCFCLQIKGKKEIILDLLTPTLLDPGPPLFRIGKPVTSTATTGWKGPVIKRRMCSSVWRDLRTPLSLMTLGREGKIASPPWRGSGPRQRDKNTAQGADRWPVLLQNKIRLVTECSGLSGPPCSPGGELPLPRGVLGFHTRAVSPALGRP